MTILPPYLHIGSRSGFRSMSVSGSRFMPRFMPEFAAWSRSGVWSGSWSISGLGPVFLSVSWRLSRSGSGSGSQSRSESGRLI